MPCLQITTNLSKAKIPDDFLQEASAVFQVAIGKPMQFVQVIVEPDVLMSFGGSTDPCASITITSVGKLGVEENKAISKVIYDLLDTKLGIPDNRAYITFFDKPKSEVGFMHTTLHEITKS